MTLELGLELRAPRDLGLLAGHTLRFELGAPVYQRLNGPQPEEDWSAAVDWELGGS